VIVLYSALDLAGVVIASDVSQQTRYAIDAGTIVTAVAASGFLLKPIRKDVAAVLPIDPENPVHTLALILAVFVFGTQITTLAFVDVLALSQSQPPLTVFDLFLDEAPFLLLGVVGVGIFIRRDLARTAERLGFVLPAWWQVTLALAAAGVFLVVAQQLDVLSHMWTPQVAHRVDTTTQHVFGQLGGPFGIAAIGLLPGICEELLFRGALQPRIGLVTTALLFTSIHTQYALSLDTVAVLVIALGLGAIRKYTNTTTSCGCHVGYNLLVGIGLGGAALNVAILVELALLGVTAYAIWSRRRARSAGQP